MATIIARKGDRGKKVSIIQRLLKVYPDGIFGNLTETAVKDFQKKHNLAADGIVGIKTWVALFGNIFLPSKRDITEIIIHCSATTEGKDYTVADITAWHKQRGFSTIGYHYVIYRNGSIHEGRDVDIAGAHCQGHNANSIGVCYIGGLDKCGRSKDTRTEEQKESLRGLVADLRRLYLGVKVFGHRDASPDINHDGKIEQWEWLKDCPCFEVKKEF